MDELQSQNENN